MRKALVLLGASLLGALMLGALLLGAGVPPAAAEEAKTPISATMFLQMTAPIESRAAAFDAALRDPGALAKPVESGFADGEVLPDGSVRYGRTTVTVRNPCPPSEHALSGPPSLPGRRARN